MRRRWFFRITSLTLLLLCLAALEWSYYFTGVIVIGYKSALSLQLNLSRLGITLFQFQSTAQPSEVLRQPRRRRHPDHAHLPPSART